MTRAKLRHIIPIREQLVKLRGKTIVAKDITEITGIKALTVGKILSSYFEDIVEHVGYERVGENMRGRKRYKVRYFE